MPEGLGRGNKGPREATRKAISLINERSRALGRPLSVREAVEVVRVLPEYESASRGSIFHLIRRHSLTSVQFAQPTKNHPTTRNLEARIRLAVQKIRVSGGVPFRDVVAEMLEMTEAQLTDWFKDHNFTPKDFDVITHNEKLRLLYLSVGEIFHRERLKFSMSLIAQCLVISHRNVSSYLQEHEDVYQELKEMGLVRSKRGRPRKST